MKFLDKLKSLPDKVEVEVGIFNNVSYPKNSIPVVKVAKWNKEGTSKIPKRDFFEPCLKDFKKYTKESAKKFQKKLIKGIIDENIIDELGITAANRLRQSVIDFKDPPNAPSTIKRKGFNNPLIETGLMRDSITWKRIK